MSEEQLRIEAVRRRLEGESPTEIAVALGRTTRWVRKWVARHAERDDQAWAQSVARAPLFSPTRTPVEVERQVLASRARLVANRRAQYGSLAIEWDLRRAGITTIPPARTIERILERAGVANPRQRRAGKYVSKNVPYPNRAPIEPGTTHQIDMIGPRHLFGAARFHTLNLIDVGSHRVGNHILTETKPSQMVAGLCGIWNQVGVPAVAQFDNHTNFRGAIPPAWQHFSPIVATCLDLDVIPRFIPIREPWRNGVVEHFNDVWDKSFFRTEVFNNSRSSPLREHCLCRVPQQSTTDYSAHGGAEHQTRCGRTGSAHATARQLQATTVRLPAKGRIEVVRYIRSNQQLGLFGKRITLTSNDIHQYVTAIIKVRTRKLVVVVDIDGQVIHDIDFNLSRELR